MRPACSSSRSRPTRFGRTIEQLFADDQAAARMGRAARARAENEYSAPRHVERLLGVYEETLDMAA